ncbi:hypothetical protein SAMN05216605_12537 [Pseudomonas abietaniphila]|uniref:Uncharacterized protein n=1 Tax=Pseudomonas abietaniphila TaxID=89065 RepID=A0A1G8SGK5_9PSED|nr:hypothetical protein SAMN05216605_12537 [Pseudomonas abietaniphila]
MAWLFWRNRPSRPESWHDKQERSFIEAIKKLKNFEVTEGGGVSIAPEELQQKVLESRTQNRQFVDSAHRRSAE